MSVDCDPSVSIAYTFPFREGIGEVSAEGFIGRLAAALLPPTDGKALFAAKKAKKHLPIKKHFLSTPYTIDGFFYYNILPSAVTDKKEKATVTRDHKCTFKLIETGRAFLFSLP